MRVIEEGVHVWQWLEPGRHGCLAGINDGGPSVSFLADRAEDIVVSIEGEERTQLHPAVA